MSSCWALLLPVLAWQPPGKLHTRAVQYYRRAATPHLFEATAESRVTELLELCAITDRGQRASPSERSRAVALVAALEAEAPEAKALALNGRWRLIYSSEVGAYRSSPFFAAFAQCTRSLKTPVGIPSSTVQQGDAWAAAVYALTDAIPFYDVGAVTQTLQGVCDEDEGCEVEDDGVEDGPADGVKSEEEPSDGTSDKASLEAARNPSLVSEVSIEVSRLFGLSPMSSMMTTSAKLEEVRLGSVKSEIELTLKVDTTAAKDSTLLSMLPVFGELPTFPSGDAMELINAGSSRIRYRTSYLSDNLRISRYVTEIGESGQLDDSAFFIYLREVM